MNVYHLGAIDSGHPSWRISNEKNSVWACAPDAKAARDLVAAKTRVTAPDADGVKTPWEDDAITSCVLDPTISVMRAGTVVRMDGSVV